MFPGTDTKLCRVTPCRSFLSVGSWYLNQCSQSYTLGLKGYPHQKKKKGTLITGVSIIHHSCTERFQICLVILFAQPDQVMPSAVGQIFLRFLTQYLADNNHLILTHTEMGTASWKRGKNQGDGLGFWPLIFEWYWATQSLQIPVSSSIKWGGLKDTTFPKTWNSSPRW